MHSFTENLLVALDGAQDEQAVFQALLRAARTLGFDHCAYGLKLAVPVTNPKVLTLNNYPSEWQRRYHEAGYLGVDPSVQHGQTSRKPLIWTDDLFAKTPELWAEARDHGLSVGWAQSSLDGFGVGGMLTLSRSGEAFTATELHENDSKMRWLVQAAHLSLSRLMQSQYVAEPDTPLTGREIEVLKWTADGKTAADIGDILNISLATVNFHIKNAVLKLKVANKTSAVVHALMHGLLH